MSFLNLLEANTFGTRVPEALKSFFWLVMKNFLANQKQEFQMRLPGGEVGGRSAILPVNFVDNDFAGQYSALFGCPWDLWRFIGDNFKLILEHGPPAPL